MPEATDLVDLMTWTALKLDLAISGSGASMESKALEQSMSARIFARLDGPAGIRSRFRLTANAAQVIWMLAAIELDSSLRFLPMMRHGVTIEVIKTTIYGCGPRLDALDDLGPSGTLRRLGLIEPVGSPDLHDSRQSWAISRRVLTWLHGDHAIDPVIAKYVRFGIAKDVAELAMNRETIEAACAAMAAKQALVVACGSPLLGRRTLLAAASNTAGIETLEIDTKQLATDPAILATQLRMIARECKLLGRSPLLRDVDTLAGENPIRLDLLGSELISELDGIVLLTSDVRRPQIRCGRPVITIDVKPPSTAQRASLWRAHLTEASESDGDRLARIYPLAPALIEGAAKATSARAIGRRVTPVDVTAGVRSVLDDRLGNFAKRIEVTQTWEDLVLPEHQAQTVNELIGRIRERSTVYETWGFAAKVGKGLGVSALFSGPPGTGKTMVAALIARELGLELYQVDTGKLVSKWIGETEKHLGELFDAAEAGHAVLLFDEADSIFGKRTDVKSSNDRYANLETNYLLQRLERFTGICLLTSNHESTIDPAFQRRLSLHLRFEVPDQAEREHLWRVMLPATAPVAPDIDFESLARRYEMTGGYIRNAALRAAFLAANDGTRIAAAHLEHAASLEYEGMGKIATSVASPAWPPKKVSSL